MIAQIIDFRHVLKCHWIHYIVYVMVIVGHVIVTISCLDWNFTFWPGNSRIIFLLLFSHLWSYLTFMACWSLCNELRTVSTVIAFALSLFCICSSLRWGYQICMSLGFWLSFWFSRLENRDACLLSFNILSRHMMWSMRWMAVLEWQFTLVLFKSLMGNEEMRVDLF